ncbi:hypothetical protein A2U01_0082227, partial [Trifolium medium]|nr:hypothetical protein [Trifolium medium]
MVRQLGDLVHLGHHQLDFEHLVEVIAGEFFLGRFQH